MADGSGFIVPIPTCVHPVWSAQIDNIKINKSCLIVFEL